MKKRNEIILSWLILGILLICAGSVTAQTVWVACSFDTSAFVPQKGRPDKFERRFYVSELVSMSKSDFLAKDENGDRIEGNCGDYFEKTVFKAAEGRGERIDTSGSLKVYRNIGLSGENAGGSRDVYSYAPKETIEKLRADAIKEAQGAERVIYNFNWDTTGKNEVADLQRESSGATQSTQVITGSTNPQFKNTDAGGGGGDVKDRISSLITLPANQIPLKQPKVLLVNGLKEDANYVLRAANPADILKKSEIDDYDYKNISAVQDKTVSALQKLKMLFEAGTSDSETVDLATGQLTLGELAEMLLDINRNAIYVGMINKLEQTAMRTKIWVGDVGTKGKLNYDQLEQAAMEGEKLEKLVVEAQRIGFPDDFKINFQNQDYTLPDLKEMGHYVGTAGGQLKAEIEAERAAKDAPYLKVLTGDKARIFKEEFGGQGGMWEAYGNGGKILNSPAAMSGATVWFTYGNSRGIIDTWHITGWRFQGDKLVGRISRSGYGLKPSAGAYR